MSSFLLYTGFGLVSASILCVSAIGFTLQFGISNLFNLAFGSTMTAGAFIAYLGNANGLNIWVSLVLGTLGAALLSLLISKAIFAPFKARLTGLFGLIMVTLGVGIILQYTMEAIWGANNVSYNMAVGRPVHVAGMIFTSTQLIVIGISALVSLSVHSLLKYTRVGKAMRAIAVNEHLARNCGIPVRRVIDLTWLLSGGLAGLAGVALVMDVQLLYSGTGSDFLILIVAAAVLGGVGSPYGAMLGALIIGVASEVAAGFIDPAFKTVTAFIVLGLVLLIRPTGIANSVASAKEVAR
jgi:branched-chain amino acid transport system permease protein/neutral amino acid transport system permease protein